MLEQRAGLIYATLAYFMWGFFPIYWKFLQHLPALEILCHRVLWAFIFYSVVMLYRRRRQIVFWPQDKKLFRNLALASLFIMFNWFIYIYGVTSEQVVETSLGYFINPLVNMALGVVVLKERLSRGQTMACLMAGVGVVVIGLQQGRLPWLALALAFSFAFYGLIKKTNPVEGLKSNQFESSLMLPVAAGLLFYLPSLAGAQPFPLEHGFDWVTLLLLVGGGPITGLPLVFFAEAAQRLPMYLLGFFQFLAPSIQFLSGVFLFNEPMTQYQLIGFVFIWAAGILVVIENRRNAYINKRR